VAGFGGRKSAVLAQRMIAGSCLNLELLPFWTLVVYGDATVQKLEWASWLLRRIQNDRLHVYI
jgi:hypothetical protein